MNSRVSSNHKFSLLTFLIAFLIGGTFVYFASPALPMRTIAQHDEHEHEHEHEHEDEEEHEHEHEDEEEHEHEHEDEDEHEHEHEHDALALNNQALANIGIEPGEAGMIVLTPNEYKKSFSFPGFVRYKPGRSLVDIPSPAAGVITKIYAEEGEALCPGEPLFDVQLTHEELASCQLAMLELLQKHDLLISEQERLAKLVAGTEPKTQREVELQIRENDAAIEAQKQALRFLGVPLETIEEKLVKNRDLITSCTVRAPMIEEGGAEIATETIEVHQDHSPEHFQDVEHFQQLEKIFVEKGQTVTLGSSLCVVSDLRDLWIEGKAFESDEGVINKAYSQNKPVSASFASPISSRESENVDNLTIRSVSNRIDASARTFACYIDLKNYLLTNDGTAPASTAVPLLNWRFKPGQRCEISIETETLTDVFVVPVAATAQEGCETFLFEYIGEEDGKPIWHKRPVVVRYQTARDVVIANDGSIKEGAKIAKTGAYQLYVALTNGGGKLQSACPCGDHDHGHEH